jgi:serine/threonine-protein kinase
MLVLEVNQTRKDHEQNVPDSDPFQLVGSVVDGRYLVEAKVAVGGFGIVYRARHIRFDGMVALKVLFPSDDAPLSNPASSVQGTQEGRLQFQLAALHSSFVRVFETGHVTCYGTTTVPYLAMEWLEGVTLKTYLDSLISSNRRLSLETVLHLFDDLAQALAIAHARRVAHRDLKPSNIYLVGNDGQIVPKLLDFGEAKVGATGQDNYDDTLQNARAFTPAYAAPEQWDRSIGATGTWTDVYAFALVIVELILGRHWYPDNEEPQFGRRTLDALNRPTPRTLGLDVNNAVESVFVRALALAPRERYSDLLTFWSSLCKAADFQRPQTPLRLDALGVTLPYGSIRLSSFGETNALLSSRRKSEPTESLEESSSSPNNYPVYAEWLKHKSRDLSRSWRTSFTVASLAAGVTLFVLIIFPFGKPPEIADATPLPSEASNFKKALPSSSALLGISMSGLDAAAQQCPVTAHATPTTVLSVTREKRIHRETPLSPPRKDTRRPIATTDTELPLLPEFASRGAPISTTTYSKQHTFAHDFILDNSLSTRK